MGPALPRDLGTAPRGARSRAAAEVTGLCRGQPPIVPTEVRSEPVLRAALLAAVDQARADLPAAVGA